jgi:Tautomerase enzyme
MTGVLNVPNDYRFMVITEHDQADLVISPEHLGIGHTGDVVLIQVTRNEGRTVPVKWEGLSSFRCNFFLCCYLRPALRRPSKVMSKAFRAAFHRLVQRWWPRPVGSRLMIARYRHLSAACSVGKWPRAFTALRNRALIDSIALVVQMTVLISRSNRRKGTSAGLWTACASGPACAART